MKALLVGLLFVANAMAAGKIEAEIETFLLDFTAKSSSVTGHMTKKGNKYLLGKPIKVKVDSFETGIDLRNKHMAGYMSSKGKHPYIVVNKGAAAGGKGVVLIQMNGKAVKTPFKYEVSGSTMKAEFDINLPSFGIDNVNYNGAGVEDKVQVKVELPIK